MPENTKNTRICEKGHRFTKSSSCPVCPICQNLIKPKVGFLSKLGAPARRALESHGVKQLNDLTRFSAAEIAQWHGVGPNALSKMKLALEENGLDFFK